MRRSTLTAIFLVATTLAASAAPDVATPVCAQANVLELVRNRLKHAGQPGFLEAGSIGQMPSGRDDLVYCAVRVHTVEYATPSLGPVQTDVVRVYRYALELRRNGIFLLPPRE